MVMQCMCVFVGVWERERESVCGVHQELGEQTEGYESFTQGREGRTGFPEEVHLYWSLRNNWVFTKWTGTKGTDILGTERSVCQGADQNTTFELAVCARSKGLGRMDKIVGKEMCWFLGDLRIWTLTCRHWECVGISQLWLRKKTLVGKGKLEKTLSYGYTELLTSDRSLSPLWVHFLHLQKEG